MQLIPLPHPWPRPRRHSDTFRLAFCLIFFATLARAAVPPPFSTFLQENASIFSLGHGSAGDFYTFGVLSSGTLFVSRLDPGATRIAFTLRLGGSDGERGGAMTVDGAGNMYITGSTASSDFPFNPQPPAASGKQYPFVVKVDSTGRVVYSFLLEHTAAAFSAAIAVDSDGSAVVTGYALEPGFPSAGGGYSSTIDPTFSGAYFRPFIARVDPSGTKLLSSALGAGGAHISIGPGGDIFVAGNVSGFGIGDPAKSYPVTSGAFQTTFTPSFDCSFPCQLVFPSPEQYVTRLDSALTKLVYSTFLTGTHGANNSALAVDPGGNTYVTGTTNSTDYPYSSVQPSAPRPGAFLTKLDPTGSKLLWSVQQGGDLLAFDAANHLTVAGSVFPADGLPYQHATYPPSPPAGDIPAACQPNGFRVQVAAFVQRFSALDAGLLGTQFLTATRAQPSALDVLPDGRALVAGESIFPDIAITPGTLFSSAIAQRTPSGYFLAAFDVATPSIGGSLACAADGLTNMPVGPVAPGQLVSLFGTGLGAPMPVTASISGPDPVPVSLGGVTVTFDGVAAPLLYVSSGQINLSVPWEIRQTTSTLMQVTVDGKLVASRVFAVAASSPSLFVDTDPPKGSGNDSFAAVALNADGTRNSIENPSRSGSNVTLFLNGVAAFTGNTPPKTGSITGIGQTPTSVAVSVASGTVALETGPLIAWPGVIAGVYELQVRLPASTQSSAHAVLLRVAVDGLPAAPLVFWNNPPSQSAGWIWVN